MPLIHHKIVGINNLHILLLEKSLCFVFDSVHLSDYLIFISFVLTTYSMYITSHTHTHTTEVQIRHNYVCALVRLWVAHESIVGGPSLQA